MIEYLVVKYEEPHAFAYGRARLVGQTGNAYAQATAEDHRGSEFSANASIYWAHSLIDAEALATNLNQRHIGSTWVVAKSCSVYQTQPGPQIRSLFTDAGLMPE